MEKTCRSDSCGAAAVSIQPNPRSCCSCYYVTYIDTHLPPRAFTVQAVFCAATFGLGIRTSTHSVTLFVLSTLASGLAYRHVICLSRARGCVVLNSTAFANCSHTQLPARCWAP
jgi:hypothetical protein